MLRPQIGKIAFRIAFFLVFVATGLIFVVQPGSAEFFVTAITLAIGLVSCVLIIVLVRHQPHR